MSFVKKPFVLVILDGWGVREVTQANAIAQAETPTWDKLWQQYPHTLLEASGTAVGLPKGQMGNSEVGHMHIGAGRIVRQNYTRISHAIEKQSFFSNEPLNKAISDANAACSTVHVMGLLSPGGIHSHQDHIFALLTLAANRGVQNLQLHAFLDGRDVLPQSATEYLAVAEQRLKQLGVGRIASIAGRYYAMDRDQRWERIQQVYDLLTSGVGRYTADSAQLALELAYARGETDEFVTPTWIQHPSDDNHASAVQDGDVIIFMNFRADRARQITQAFVSESFTGFKRQQRPKLGDFVSLTEYAKRLTPSCAFTPLELRQGLGEHLAALGKTQLRIAETEKYAHVTFFLNGGVETIYVGEERILVPSPKVAAYDECPAMSAVAITDHIITALQARQHDLIIVNYANGDMVGHTGNFTAAIEAVVAVDTCLARILTALSEVAGECLITADHGNVEYMYDAGEAQPHTAHTECPVPLIYVGAQKIGFNSGGTLADVAPTLLYLMGLAPSMEMTGKVLIQR